MFETYSQRQKRLNGEMQDVFIYGDIPQPLRIQIVHLWERSAKEIYGNLSDRYGGVFHTFCEVLAEELGELNLYGRPRSEYHSYFEELKGYFLKTDDNDKCLDIIDYTFNQFEKRFRKNGYAFSSISNTLNHRFKQHSVGFQYQTGEIIRVDSEFLHVETVKPALSILREEIYSGAQQEFLNAYKHYRHNNNKESLNDCLKAFESTMKAICTKRNWPFKSSDGAKTLVQICFDNGLIPSFWSNQFNALKTLLDSSVPTGRNKLSGHGQGTTQTEVPDHVVSYMLHMTASAIVFLGKAEQDLP